MAGARRRCTLPADRTLSCSSELNYQIIGPLINLEGRCIGTVGWEGGAPHFPAFILFYPFFVLNVCCTVLWFETCHTVMNLFSFYVPNGPGGSHVGTWTKGTLDCFFVFPLGNVFEWQVDKQQACIEKRERERENERGGGVRGDESTMMKSSLRWRAGEKVCQVKHTLIVRSCSVFYFNLMGSANQRRTRATPWFWFWFCTLRCSDEPEVHRAAMVTFPSQTVAASLESVFECFVNSNVTCLLSSVLVKTVKTYDDSLVFAETLGGVVESELTS